ncbi:hypothetical protein MLD38_028437 [Melastoma candidum]|uniref:Uncharacterized protein n=1 Tax=Melastoma candidum TaxID=119954 RepID=A0ACB9N0S1_9MYRT|nr:hypothetical protein MLD38_028437 [Melastoma candidum]
MASSHSDSARMEQIITEFFAKSLHIILESRSPYRSSRNFSGEQAFSSPSSSTSSSSSVRPRDKWFNLALREFPEALENLDLWRQSNHEPMIVDVILIKRSLDWDSVKLSPKPELIKNALSKDVYPNCWDFGNDDVGRGGKKEKIVERWVVQYEVKKSKDCQRGGKRSGCNVLSSFYKKSMLLLRSLYATVRLLPAYKIFRDLYLSGHIRSFSLGHRVSSFVEPFTRKEEAEMQRFGFTPVDTSCGRLCLSVQYRSSVSDISSEPSTPLSPPQLIQDYVGSPLADPLKRFPLLPVTHGSPSSVPFSRRHSWSYDQCRASPPFATCSPSPAHSEPYTSASNPTMSRLPPPGLPPHPPDTLHGPKDVASLDECYPSPIYSPSPSASPPIFIPESQLSKVLLRSESAPVNIPGLRFHNNPAIFKNQILSPSPPLREARYEVLRSYKTLGPSQTGETYETVLHGKKHLKRLSGMTSAELAFHDDFDETEYTCPFDVEDDDMAEPGSRLESFDQKGLVYEQLDPGAYLPVRKSTGAAVGALVDLLNKAPPLRQDSSISVPTSQTSGVNTCASSFPEPNQSCTEMPVKEFAPCVMASTIHVSRTASDAFEELQAYKEMKNMLLSQCEGPCNQLAYLARRMLV